MKDFTIIAVNPETGQIICDHVQATNYNTAFANYAANCQYEHEVVAAIPGKLSEDETIFFPGSGVVSTSTILEQPDVFTPD